MNGMKNNINKLRGGFSYEVSSDENLIFVAGGRIRVFETNNFTQVKAIKALSNTACISLSNDNKLLAIKNTSGKIAVADINECLILNKYSLEKSEGANCLFTPDDKYIVDADWNGNIMLIDLKEQKHKVIQKFNECSYKSIVYNSHTEEFIFLCTTTTFNFTLVVWKYPFEKEQYKLIEITPISVMSRLIYNDKYRIYTIGDGKNSIYFFDEAFNIINIKRMDFTDCDSAVLSESGKYIAILVDKYLRLYTYPEYKPISEYQESFLRKASFIKDDKKLIICGITTNVVNIDQNIVSDMNESDEDIDTSNYFIKNGLDSITFNSVPEDQLWESLYFYSLDKIEDMETTENSFEDALITAPIMLNIMYSLKWFEIEVSEGGSEQYFNNSDPKQVEALLLALKEVGADKTYNIIKKAFADISKKDLSTEYYENLDDKLDEADDLEELCINYVKSKVSEIRSISDVAEF